MKGQLSLSVWGLGGQGVELFSRSEALVPGLDHHLSLLNHVHELHTNERTLGSVERLAPSHWPRHPLYTLMILLHNVVEIRDLADVDRGAMCFIVALDGRFIGGTPVDGDLLWHAVAPDRLGRARR